MNPEEQTVTWLISLGALNSPKMMVEDPVQFLKASLKDGVVLCKLLLRLLPGSVEKYCLEPKTEADCLGNIQQFLSGCAALKVELQGQFRVQTFSEERPVRPFSGVQLLLQEPEWQV